MSADALGLGFLEHVQATLLSEADQYGFRHLTVQEYLAALYACKSLLHKAEDLARLAERLGCGEEAGHLNTFWVFVAGLLDDSLREELFCAIAETDMNTVHSSLHVADNAAKPGRAAELLGGTDGEREGTCPEGHSQQQPESKPLSDYRFLLLLHCYTEGSVIGAEKPSVCVSYVLNRIGIACPGRLGLSQSDWRAMSKAMECHSDIVKKVNVGDCFMGDNGLQQLLPGLLSCTRLKALNLAWNRLSETHMGSVGDVLSRNQRSLEELDLSRNPGVGDEGLRRCGEGLQLLQQLKRLCWWGLGLTQCSGRFLADVISHQPTLVECDLNSVGITDAGFVYIGSALQKCKHIEELCLCETDLTSSSMGLLASMLACLPQLRALDIRCNPICDDGFKLLSPGLQQCPQLRVLCLDECSLTGDGQVVALLTMMLLCVPQLEEFSLTDNQIGDAALCQLCIGLEECYQLTELHLDNTGLASPQSIVAVSPLLRRLEKVQRLDISENPFAGSSDDFLVCAAVKGHPSLETLYVAKGMRRDAIHLLQSFVADSSCVLREF